MPGRPSKLDPGNDQAACEAEDPDLLSLTRGHTAAPARAICASCDPG